jgi:hypothetical protein
VCGVERSWFPEHSSAVSFTNIDLLGIVGGNT